MELDQMVGVIRHLVAQHQGLVHMDEMLTAVLEAENRVKAAEGAVQAQDSLLQEKKAQLQALVDEGIQKAEDLETQLTSIREDNHSRSQAQIEEQEAHRLALEGSISALLLRESEVKSRLEGLQGDIDRYTKYKAAAVQEYERVKQALSALTASITV